MISSYVKDKGLDTCYSATYMSQTRDHQRFTISEVAADSHERMVPQRIMWPLPALTDNWTHGAASRHTVAPISLGICTDYINAIAENLHNGRQ